MKKEKIRKNELMRERFIMMRQQYVGEMSKRGAQEYITRVTMLKNQRKEVEEHVFENYISTS